MCQRINGVFQIGIVRMKYFCSDMAHFLYSLHKKSYQPFSFLTVNMYKTPYLLHPFNNFVLKSLRSKTLTAFVCPMLFLWWHSYCSQKIGSHQLLPEVSIKASEILQKDPCRHYFCSTAFPGNKGHQPLLLSIRVRYG